MITLDSYYERIDQQMTGCRYKFQFFETDSPEQGKAYLQAFTKARSMGHLPPPPVFNSLTHLFTKKEIAHLKKTCIFSRISVVAQVLSEEAALFYNRLEQVFGARPTPGRIKRYLLDDELEEDAVKLIVASYTNRYLKKKSPTIDILIIFSEYFTREELAVIAHDNVRDNLVNINYDEEADDDAPINVKAATEDAILADILKHLPKDYRRKIRIAREEKRSQGVLG